MNIVEHYLQKEAQRIPNPRLAREIAGRLRGLGRAAARPAVMAPAALGTGVAGMYGVEQLGEERLRAEQEAAELRALLEQYPELLNMGLLEGLPQIQGPPPGLLAQQNPYGRF